MRPDKGVGGGARTIKVRKWVIVKASVIGNRAILLHVRGNMDGNGWGGWGDISDSEHIRTNHVGHFKWVVARKNSEIVSGHSLLIRC